MALKDKIDAEVHKAEATVKDVAAPLFDYALVDIRKELPALVAKTGADTSDPHAALHAVLTLVVQLLIEFGPDAIKEVLGA